MNTTARGQSQGSSSILHTTESTLSGNKGRQAAPEGVETNRAPTDHGVQVTVEGVSAGDDQGELTTSQQTAGAHLSQTVCGEADE